MVMAVEPATPLVGRAINSVRFVWVVPPANSPEFLATAWRELQAVRPSLAMFPSGSYTQKGTDKSGCPSTAVWSGMDENRGGSLTGMSWTRKKAVARKPVSSYTVIDACARPEPSGGG